MPFFQDDLEHLEKEHMQKEASQRLNHTRPEPSSPSSPLPRKYSEESIRTELCEGPIPDSPNFRAPNSPSAAEPIDIDAATSDRSELIERLKRGESPTWVPNRHVRSDAPRATAYANISADSADSRPPLQLGSLFHGRTTPPKTSHESSKSRPPSQEQAELLPAADITPEKKKKDGPLAWPLDEAISEGPAIQRPSSALHRGDFSEPGAHVNSQHRGLATNLQEEVGTHGSNPWIATSPPRDYATFHFDRDTYFGARPLEPRSPASSLSSSLSSSFAYKPPTSPLVQSEINEELDIAMPMDHGAATSTPISTRRYTFNTSSSSPFAFSPRPLSTGGRSLKRESTTPSQAHQPRRSLASVFGGHSAGNSPRTPGNFRHRRLSVGSDSSPLHHASMVGSYEESILRGRMSTTPSKPLDFVAQIGVLGLGKCKSSLKCPSHVSIPFPAVFYSYSNNSTSHSRTQAEDGPSPYVGQIDLENGLSNQGDDHRTRKKMSSRNADQQRIPTECEDDEHGQPPRRPSTELPAGREARRAAGSRRSSNAPRAPPGGSYRIPEKGQIQMIIKNPNKTAVKLFLVPYDLAGMEPGTKTFIRQRTYAGEPPQGDSNMLGRPTLRYLVHLHVCCPSKGRYYLYKSIRVVFANRVPDDKEKLRIETTWPEPRFSAYKPIRVMHPPSSAGPGSMLAAEKAFRRRSSGFSFAGNGPAGSSSGQQFDIMDGISDSFPGGLSVPEGTSQQYLSPFSASIGSNGIGSARGGGGGGAGSSGNGVGDMQPIDPIPLRLPSRNRLGSDSDSTATTMALSPGSSQASRPTTQDGLDARVARYEKLSKGDVGYGGNVFAGAGRAGLFGDGGSPGSGGVPEGLLSQRLRGLGVKMFGVDTPEEDQKEE